MHLPIGRPLQRHEIADLLAEARCRTLLLVSRVPDEDLVRQHSSLMSPIVWDLGHIGHFEEVWLSENTGNGGEGVGGLRGLYDPSRHPRAERDRLPLPTPDEVLEELARIRGAVLEHLGTVNLASDTRLLRDGYVFRMVLQHEYQHNETILQTLQLKQGRPYRAPRSRPVHLSPVKEEEGRSKMVSFPGGEVRIGTDDRSAAYDNERPGHTVQVAPFRIDRHPVTNGRYAAFVEDGGYERRALWSDEGWRWLEESGTRAPKHWERDGEGAWRMRTMDRVSLVDPSEPVCHVCWHEARAYAHWAGKRLPTEVEWETAASWDPATAMKRRFPWGDDPPTPDRANLDQLAFGAAPVGARPRGASPVGCEEMIGDVWEWTASPFRGYPGFEVFPYPEYSQDFFGDRYRVLRGGSWATRPGAIRNTFRNWDLPVRRQIFAGFRCAGDG